MKRMALLPALAIALALPATAGAQDQQTFGTRLSGDAEIPARETDATGRFTATLVNETTMRFRLTVNNIENVVAAHIHCGDANTNGPAVQFLFGPVTPGGGPTSGLLSQGSFDPSGVTCTFGEDTVPLLQAMREGNTYVNVHTDDGEDPANTGPGDFPGGEIRGQIAILGPKS
jgi:hypothetical protein